MYILLLMGFNKFVTFNINDMHYPTFTMKFFFGGEGEKGGWERCRCPHNLVNKIKRRKKYKG